MNPFVLVNLVSILAFLLSLAGLFDWALGSVLMIGGVGLSTMAGVFWLSRRISPAVAPRLAFVAMVPISAWPALRIGEWLNERVFDGMVTLVALAYFAGLTLVLFALGLSSRKA
ncbi:MAG: hypothetical protein KF767_13155 [Bdellovibrionaceae bacterium]|nr:hypothetical protein [Pseudobdellovibrionaceae bacterium]